MSHGMQAFLAFAFTFAGIAGFVWRCWAFDNPGTRRQRRAHEQWLAQHRAEEDKRKHEKAMREADDRARERVENRATLPRKWANEVERELEAGRKHRQRLRAELQ